MQKILIVEDDETIRYGLKYYLEQESFEIYQAGTAKEAFEKFERETLDMVLLDLNLPDGNGFDLYREMKKKKEVPTIFLTANDQEVSIVMGLDMGADDYITKPFKVRELLSRIKTVLRRSGKKDDSVIQVGDVTLDMHQAKVFKNGVDVMLTALEYKIFLTLVLNYNQVLKRETILANIWDVNEEYVNDNTL
ncbi:MAG: response regulator transcription factor, partial [Firmicutes bacterium]|nr:response regulator transcription factor [Bacillota bacterium]